MYKNKGFTLIELMIVIAIFAIIMAIAIPSYRSYVQTAAAARAQQEVLRLAEQLERYKSKSFSYRGFDPGFLYGLEPGLTQISIPNAAKPEYTIQIADISESTPTTLLSTGNGLGRVWGISAIPQEVGFDAILMNSNGVRCKQKFLTQNDISQIKTFTGCGENAKKW